MNFMQWIEGRIAQLHWYDITLIKVSCVCFGLLVAKLWTPILEWNWYWYLVLTIVFAFIPTYDILFKKNKES
jgi:hypothetical protein